MYEETQKSFLVLSLSHNLRFTGVQGRFLASLEMTIWGKRYSRLAAFRIRKWERTSGVRVLSLIACLSRFFSLIFIPPAPYPSRFARHLPHMGKALVRGKRYSRVLLIFLVDCVFACQQSSPLKKGRAEGGG